MEGGYDPDCRRTFDWDFEDRESDVKNLIKFLTSLKHSPGFASAETCIRCENGLLIAERGGYRLTVKENGDFTISGR